MTHHASGLALAGGGPLGAIYEIGALVALDEALHGFDFTECDVHVGVSSGSFVAAGLANGLTPLTMHDILVGTDNVQDRLDLDILLRPAIAEYGARLASTPPLLLAILQRYLENPRAHGILEIVGQFGATLPTGIFDNAAISEYLTKLFSYPPRTNDFRRLRHKLFIVGTDLDSGAVAPFGAPGWDDIPIAQAVQASAALPGLYPPVEINGHWYVDGILNKTLHASLALREGVKLLFCINPLVPFNAELAAHNDHKKRVAIVEGGLPLVLSQTFRSIIHSRMEVTMGRYKSEFPDADILLFEPSRDDREMFFSNVFSYADRHRLSEHAYQRTRAELLRRYDELQPVFVRHGVTLDKAVLTDRKRTLARSPNSKKSGRLTQPAGNAAQQLEQTLDRLDGLISELPVSRRPTPKSVGQRARRGPH